MNPLQKRLLSFLIAFAIVNISAGQTKAEQVEAIRKEFQAINGDSTLEKITLKDKEFMGYMTDGGGELTGYYSNGQVKKIREWAGLSHGNEIKEFYFRDGKLIFVYEQFNSFPFDGKKGEYIRYRPKTTFEGRYYFNNDKLIDQKVTGKKQFESKTDTATKLLSEASEWIKRLEKKRN
ncbi:MAG TPA: hypothetical protein VGB46_04485 [Flavisolibacter sp.]|jgi:hypothetical protein